MIDDAFYALAVSRNLALGHGLSADGVNRASGFQRLEVFECAALSLLVGADSVTTFQVIVILSGAVWFAFAWSASVQARRRAEVLGMEGKAAWLCAAEGVLGSYVILGQVHSGFETSTTLLFMAAAAQYLSEYERNWRWSCKNGLVLSLPCYARLDAVVLVLAYVALQLVDVVRHRRIYWQGWARCILVALIDSRTVAGTATSCRQVDEPNVVAFGE